MLQPLQAQHATLFPNPSILLLSLPFVLERSTALLNSADGTLHL